MVPYDDALTLQRELVEARKADRIPDTLLLLEHPHVLTLGVRGSKPSTGEPGARSGNWRHVIATPERLAALGVSVVETGRGGDVTYHGPGQIVGYPILDLRPDRQDVHRYVRDLEEVLIRTCGDFAINAHRVAGLTGAWVDHPVHGPEKVAAIGVRIARWITSHGFALNVTHRPCVFRPDRALRHRRPRRDLDAGAHRRRRSSGPRWKTAWRRTLLTFLKGIRDQGSADQRSVGITLGRWVFLLIDVAHPLGSSTDNKLISRLRAGEDGAVADLVNAHGARVYQMAIRYLKNAEDAEELTQDVLFKAVDKIREFRGDSALSSWLYRITFNAAMSRLRHLRGVRAAEVSGDSTTTRAPMGGPPRFRTGGPWQTKRFSAPSCATVSPRRCVPCRRSTARRSSCATSAGSPPKKPAACFD